MEREYITKIECQFKLGLPEIVRCKDCKYCEPFEDDALIWCNIHEFGRKPDYYCADGEWKGGEADG